MSSGVKWTQVDKDFYSMSIEYPKVGNAKLTDSELTALGLGESYKQAYKQLQSREAERREAQKRAAKAQHNPQQLDNEWSQQYTTPPFGPVPAQQGGFGIRIFGSASIPPPIPMTVVEAFLGAINNLSMHAMTESDRMRVVIAMERYIKESGVHQGTNTPFITQEQVPVECIRASDLRSILNCDSEGVPE